MHIKIQSQGIAGGSNTGSCKNYVQYLQHENDWKKDQGLSLDIIPFFDKNGVAISEKDVLKNIDKNKSHLHADDAKFFSCIIAFSENEIPTMGQSREDRISAVHQVVEKFMDRYAIGFGAKEIKTHEDLLYYYTIHEYREKEDNVQTPGIHVHLIISRKDAKNKIKLSPMTCHKEGSTGVIKRGFNRNDFYRDCEVIFDNTFSYLRKVEESFDYCNALAHGTAEEKEFQLKRALDEKCIAEDISAALSSRIKRLAEEAISKQRSILSNLRMRQLADDKALRNKYWNDYFKYYKPQLQSLVKICGDCFTLYSDAKDKYNAVKKETSEKYNSLKELYGKMDVLEQEIQQARKSKYVMVAVSTLIAFLNPIPALLISFTSAIIFGVQKNARIDAKRDLRRRAAAIYESIDNLKIIQKDLSNKKENSLKKYLKVKDEKQQFVTHQEQLKKQLEAPLEKNEKLISLAKRYEAYMKSKSSNIDKDDDVKNIIISCFSFAKSRLDMEQSLLKYNILMEEVSHENGGVADFMFTSKDGKTIAAHDFCSEKQIYAMFNKWENLTGKTPAYKVETSNQPSKKMK